MTFIRKFVRKNKDGTIKTYYAEVESRWVEGKIVQSYIRPLGTDPNAPNTIPIDGMHFSYIATRLMQGDLTANELIEMVEKMGHKVHLGDLEAVGIKYSFKKNSMTLSLFPVRQSKTQKTARNAEQNSRQKKRTKGK